MESDRNVASSVGVRCRKMLPRLQAFDRRPPAVAPVIDGFRRPVADPVDAADDPPSDDIESGLAPSRLEPPVVLFAGRREATFPFTDDGPGRDIASGLDGRFGVKPEPFLCLSLS